MSDDETEAPGLVRMGARALQPPALISDAARENLGLPRLQPRRGYPAVDDLDGWRRIIAKRDAEAAKATAPLLAKLKADVTPRGDLGAPVQVATPHASRRADDDRIVYEIHGGALLFGAGEGNVRYGAARTAVRTGRTTVSVDYRMPPDHPYPAALDDCLAVYRGLLAEGPADRIVVYGTSAGGNLAAALLLRARDERLAMPAGAILLTPELDLTEQGDSFNTLLGLDVVLPERLMSMNLVYAAGADLAHPYLSPLFGDVSGFPPTFLQAGTRDIFLSNTVIMHRKLRSAGVRADLHVWEGMPHGGFGGETPEDREIGTEIRAFLASL